MTVCGEWIRLLKSKHIQTIFPEQLVTAADVCSPFIRVPCVLLPFRRYSSKERLFSDRLYQSIHIVKST